MTSSRLAALILATLALPACLADGPVKIAYNDRPRELGDGWAIGDPEEHGFDAAKLQQAYRLFFSEDELVPAISLLVVRGGVLVAEGYARDLDDVHRKNAIMSATKSVTSLVTGVAVDRGLVDLERPLGAYLPSQLEGLGERKAQITLPQLLTMRSGLEFPNHDFSMVMAHEVEGDGLRYILERPLARDPGSRFDYQDCDPHLVSGAIQAAVGRSMAEFADEALLGPLGITDRRWLAHADGVTYGPYGLYLKPRDFAKLGLLALGRGRWGDRQLVSRAWMLASTTARVFPSNLGEDRGLGYGFYWWVRPEARAFFAWGHGGQYLYAVPEEDLLVVVTAEPDTTVDGGDIRPPAFFALADLVSAALR